VTDTLVRSKSSVRRGYSAICTPRKKSCGRCYQISRLSSPVLCFPVNVGRATIFLFKITRRNVMANKNVKINKKTAYQGLVGWSGGKPAITKANPEVIKDPAKLKPKDLEITVDDGGITSS